MRKCINGRLKDGNELTVRVYGRKKKTISLIATRHITLEIAVRATQSGITRRVLVVIANEHTVVSSVLIEQTVPYAVGYDF
jgi:hypothetical protein